MLQSAAHGAIHACMCVQGCHATLCGHAGEEQTKRRDFRSLVGKRCLFFMLGTGIPFSKERCSFTAPLGGTQHPSLPLHSKCVPPRLQSPYIPLPLILSDCRDAEHFSCPPAGHHCLSLGMGHSRQVLARITAAPLHPNPMAKWGLLQIIPPPFWSSREEGRLLPLDMCEE